MTTMLPATVRRRRLPLSVLGLLLTCATARAEEAPRPGARIANVTVEDIDGQPTSLLDPRREAQAVVVAFGGVHCPVATVEATRIGELSRTYGARGVRFLMVDANRQERSEIPAFRAAMERAGFRGSIVFDEAQVLVKRLGVTRTSEVVLLDADLVLRYRGALDDQYATGRRKASASAHHLVDALEAVLAGREVATPLTEPEGCLITPPSEEMAAGASPRTPEEGLTYHRDIAPILQRSCLDCHRPGQIGPFSLLTYEQAEGWSHMIGEVVENRRMPPWHADPRYGSWKNDRSLPEADRRRILDWIETGAVEGTPAGGAAEAGSAPAGTWQLGEPDLIVQAPEIQVPATGVIDYIYRKVPTGLTQDRWVRAAEVRPGARAVVHHVLVFVKYPPERRAEEPPIDGGLEAGYFACMVPGERPNVYPEGVGKLLPAGSTLVFQLHYTTNGTETVDRTQIALYFCDEGPKKEMVTRGINHKRIKIPPRTPDIAFETFWKPPTDIAIYSFMPHMHFRGKAFRYELEQADGSFRTLLDVPAYDFAWQAIYQCAEPIRVPRGAKIRCRAAYDNSAANRYNPDPDQTVRWGDQSWDEMFIGYLDYVELD